MTSIKRSIKYQLKEDKGFSMSFWIIIIIVNILFYAINFYLSNKGSLANIGMMTMSLGSDIYTKYVSVAGANFLAIFIAFVAYTYNKYYEKLPLSLSFSVTRKDFMNSLIISNLLVAFIFSLIQGILLKIDPLIIKALGMNPIYEFEYINTSTDNIIYIFSSTFLISLVFISIWNVIASLNYKFGGKIWFIFIGINILLNSNALGRYFLSSYNLFDNVLRGRNDLLKSSKYIILIPIFYGITYLITKTINIKYKSN